jgi:hypothetical protein
LVHAWSRRRLIGLAGPGGAGQDTFDAHVLQPPGDRRLGLTDHRQGWLVRTGRATWEEIFHTKPPPVRELLQEDLSRARSTWGEGIWRRTLRHVIRLVDEVVGVDCDRIAICDLRFLIEMRGMKAMGGKIIHLAAPHTTVPAALRGHRSESELVSPEVLESRGARSS